MKPNYCIHFNGIQNDKCRSGLQYEAVARPLTEAEIDWHRENYSEFPVEGTAIAERIPCCIDNKDTPTCPKFRLPTQAELQKHEAEMNEFVAQFLERLIIVRPAIMAHIINNGKEGRNTAGAIDCPVCKAGEVHYRYAGDYNGHVGAKCTTPDCIEWQE